MSSPTGSVVLLAIISFCCCVGFIFGVVSVPVWFALQALLLSHPKRDIRDTSRYKPFRMVSKVDLPTHKL